MIRTMEELLNCAASRNGCRMAVAVAQDPDVLEAVFSARDRGLVEPILVGDKNAIMNIGHVNGLAVEDVRIIDEPDKGSACMIAASLVKAEEAELLMKGFVDTSLILKAVLNKENNLRTDCPLSHVLVLQVPGFDRLMYVTDSAMMIAPDLEQKVSIVKNAVTVAHALGNANPKVAALCAVEKVNPKMPCTLDAEELTKMNQNQEITGCEIQGPLALDNAVSEKAAKHKGIGGNVAGKADILLAPDIEAGNILNKSMEYFAGAKKAGVIMGAKIPVVLTSRATSSESKMYSIALGVLVAMTGNRERSAVK